MCAENADKSQVLRSLIERKIAENFPREMPVTGKDILNLGVPPSSAVRNILNTLRERFKQTNATREELLAKAVTLVNEIRPKENSGTDMESAG